MPVLVVFFLCHLSSFPLSHQHLIAVLPYKYIMATLLVVFLGNYNHMYILLNLLKQVCEPSETFFFKCKNIHMFTYRLQVIVW